MGVNLKKVNINLEFVSERSFNAWLVSSFQVDGFLEGFVEAAAFHLWAGLV